jgi:EAL domain-containing protein (putative c-di-GMP-specific phosphodiesterase class I)
MRAVIGSLGLKVTVEGVEAAQQIALPRELGCDQIQGFWFGRPMPAAEAAGFILADFHRATEPAGPAAQVA